MYFDIIQSDFISLFIYPYNISHMLYPFLQIILLLIIIYILQYFLIDSLIQFIPTMHLNIQVDTIIQTYKQIIIQIIYYYILKVISKIIKTYLHQILIIFQFSINIYYKKSVYKIYSILFYYFIIILNYYLYHFLQHPQQSSYFYLSSLNLNHIFKLNIKNSSQQQQQFIIIILHLMLQQLIIQIQDNYPFELVQIQYHDQRVFVRKTVSFFNPKQYKQIQQKIGILKKLKHGNLVSLVKVLEGQNNFHLIYEYVPFKIEKKIGKLKDVQIQELKGTIINLSLFLHENQIDLNFQSKSLGFDKHNHIKYYLDPSFLIISKNQQALKIKYSIQINKIFQNLKSNKIKNTLEINKLHFSQKRKNLLTSQNTKSNRNLTKTNTSQQIQTPNKNNLNKNKIQKSIHKSICTTQSPSQKNQQKSKHKQILKSIEEKIQDIKKKIKQYPNNSKSKNKNIQIKKNSTNLPQNQLSFLSNLGKNNNIQKKTQISIKTNYIQPSTNQIKIPQRSLQNSQNSFKFQIHQNTTSKQEYNSCNQKINQNKQQKPQKLQLSKISGITQSTQQHTVKIQNQKPSQQRNYPKLTRQPSTKKDFQQLQKSSFQNFFNSKQTYVHEFLGLLQDKGQNNKISPQKQAFNQCQTPRSLKYSQKSLKQDLQALKTQLSQIKKQKKITLYPYKTYNILDENSNQGALNNYKSQKSLKNTPRKPSKIFVKQSMVISKPQKIQLKNRISKALQKCDIALSTFRKQSTHSLNSQLSKRK